MDAKNKKGLIAVGITLGLAGIAYYFFVRNKKDNVGGVSSSENLEILFEKKKK